MKMWTTHDNRFGLLVIEPADVEQLKGGRLLTPGPNLDDFRRANGQLYIGYSEKAAELDRDPPARFLSEILERL